MHLHASAMGRTLVLLGALMTLVWTVPARAGTGLAGAEAAYGRKEYAQALAMYQVALKAAPDPTSTEHQAAALGLHRCSVALECARQESQIAAAISARDIPRARKLIYEARSYLAAHKQLLQ